ncbi:hypothetical protein QFC19_001289 [Naganishia cerealis]|uniref:Uncharacterized protein n=1 Tax=Naganishia cerealis TaxID=610337 RepID=A0ACC2WJ25_9TREE|nr:hypothetical protein QFC19_001289 [Naganishia cerealis]
MTKRDAARSSLPSGLGGLRSSYTQVEQKQSPIGRLRVQDESRGTDEMQDATDGSRAAKIQEALAKLTRSDGGHEQSVSSPTIIDQQNLTSPKATALSLGKSTPPASPSPEFSPPRFLHHLAPDLEHDLSVSRRAAAAGMSDNDDDDDPLELFTASSTTAGAGNGSKNKMVRKRMSNPLLGEPYYPNPNPVKGWTIERERERRKGRGLTVFPEEQEDVAEMVTKVHVPPTPTNGGMSVPAEKKSVEHAWSPASLRRPTDTLVSATHSTSIPAEGRRKVSGSAFRNVILPPSDIVTSELKRQQPSETIVGSFKGVARGMEQSMAKLGIQDNSTDATPLFRPTQLRKTLVSNNQAVVLPGSTTTNATKKAALGLGRPSSSSILTVPSAAGQPGNKRIVSIGKTDGRVLGKHLPRIVSASKRTPPVEPKRQYGVDEQEDLASVKEQGVGVNEAAPGLSVTTTPSIPDHVMPSTSIPTRPTARASKVEEIRNGLIRKSLALERKQESTASERDAVRSEHIAATRPLLDGQASSAKASWRDRSLHVNDPRATSQYPKADSPLPASPIKKVLPDGRGMAGLTGKAVEAPLISPRPGLTQRQDSISSVTGYGSRLRLSRGLPLSSSSANLAPAPLPSKRLHTNWMDKQRKALVAYEYLCHVGEAQQWIEGCLGEELGWGVVEMEEEMRDGVALAKLVRVYEGEQVVKTIWEDKKHRFRQSDNINYFLTFVRSIGMPETFIFELTDLYDKKNMPKVIYCIHVLSHLLARLGKADKIGNLVGQFDFSDEQLAEAQKGLQGVAMPNFSSVGTALAKECNIEPEEEQETEEEEPSILRFQSRARGALTRRKLCDELEERSSLDGIAGLLQAAARGVLVRRLWRQKVEAVHQASSPMISLQACARASLAQGRMRQTRQTHLQASPFVIKLQTHARGCLQRRKQREQATHLQTFSVQQSLTLVQATARGRLARQRHASKTQAIRSVEATGTYSALQDQIRGVLLRKKLRTQVQTLDQAANTVIAIQAQARGVLVRKRQDTVRQELCGTNSAVLSLQALARARLAKQSYKDMQKVFRKVEVTSSIGGFQALLRSRLAKKSTTEQKKRLDFVAPDVVGFQALSRGVLARREYHDWLGYLKEDDTQAGITFLQQLLRGQLARRRLWGRLDYIYSNMNSIVKVQALWRGRKQREKYRKIVSGQHVDIAAIQNYMHLLDDSENDFNEQVQIERMRKQVVDRIRTNQLLESQVLDLDNKIALILQNRLSFEDLVRVKGRLNTASEARIEEQTFNIARSDPFSHDAHLDKTLWHRRELYQRMFFILQTEPKYLARLLRLQTASDASEQDRRLLQSVILALYSYGQGRREEYLLLKMLQVRENHHHSVYYLGTDFR